MSGESSPSHFVILMLRLQRADGCPCVCHPSAARQLPSPSTTDEPCPLSPLEPERPSTARMRRTLSSRRSITASFTSTVLPVSPPSLPVRLQVRLSCELTRGFCDLQCTRTRRRSARLSRNGAESGRTSSSPRRWEARTLERAWRRVCPSWASTSSVRPFLQPSSGKGVH